MTGVIAVQALTFVSLSFDSPDFASLRQLLHAQYFALRFHSYGTAMRIETTRLLRRIGRIGLSRRNALRSENIEGFEF